FYYFHKQMLLYKIKLVKSKNIWIFWTVFFSLIICSSCDKDSETEEDLIAPDGYQLLVRDEFESFNSMHWSKGLKNDLDEQI
mgnify:CR=1